MNLENYHYSYNDTHSMVLLILLALKTYGIFVNYTSTHCRSNEQLRIENPRLSMYTGVHETYYGGTGYIEEVSP